MTCFRLLGVAVLLLCYSTAPSAAQYIPPDAERTLHPPNARENQAEQDDLPRRMAETRQKQRFEDMKRDSQKILELATELKQYVDQSGENVLSVEVVRKAEELEKLAHQVKNNMRGE